MIDDSDIIAALHELDERLVRMNNRLPDTKLDVPMPPAKPPAPAVQIHPPSVAGAMDHLRAALAAMIASRDRLAKLASAQSAAIEHFIDVNEEAWALQSACESHGVNAARAEVEKNRDLPPDDPSRI